MNPIQPHGRYDQGFFNTACSLIDELVPRNYIFFTIELDVSGMDAIRAAARRADRTAPSYTAFVIKAAACALLEHPHLNCMIQKRLFSKCLKPLPDITATVAVERMEDGVDLVFAPMLTAPDQRSLADLTENLQHYSEASVESVPEYARFMILTRIARWLPTLVGWLFRVPSLSPGLWRKYRGGAFAVTSPGKYGGPDSIAAPWPWPMTFLFGHVKPRVWAKNGEVTVCRTVRLTIAAERCVANGAPLARFAERVRELLECPEQLEQMEPVDTPATLAPVFQESTGQACSAVS